MKKNYCFYINSIFILGVLSIVLTGCDLIVKPEPEQNNTITDIESNVYKTVTIGTQVWMAENLKTTKYKDGTTIPLVTDNKAWEALTTPGFCWYNNDAATNKATYGALYNWYTVNTGKLCPTAWHVPTDVEWTTLTTYLGGENIAGGKLKATILWASPNTGSNNSSGFTALPSGSRNSNGAFVNIGYTSIWWSHTETSIGNDIFRYINYSSSDVVRGDYGKQDGFSVRCIKDN